MTKDVKLTRRDTYTVKTFLSDVKKLRLTPTALYTIGSEVLYSEWQEARKTYGDDDEVVAQINELLSFMQTDYERRLLEGDIRREADTPNATLSSFLKDTPIEFQSYVFHRPGEYIRGVLKAAKTIDEREIQRYERIEVGLRSQMETRKKDPNYWNQVRIVLWILGRYEDASDAFKKAKKFGWDKSKADIVGI